MSLSLTPSRVTLPLQNTDCETVLDFLSQRFPAISRSTWQQRMLDGNVHWQDGEPITSHTPYQAQRQLCYYREVTEEPIIPFEEEIVFRNEHLLVAHKPHFLPVMQGGVYVNECLQNRLYRRTGFESLHALHRLDRDTAGLVMFSINPESRALYHALFTDRLINKTYQAIAATAPDQNLHGKEWEIKNRLEPTKPTIIMKIADGEANSHSLIRCIQQLENRALFELQPISGRMHQLRLHMMSLGMPIENDRFYPELQPKQPDNFNKPLKLLASRLEFSDPVTGRDMLFESPAELNL